MTSWPHARRSLSGCVIGYLVLLRNRSEQCACGVGVILREHDCGLKLFEQHDQPVTDRVSEMAGLVEHARELSRLLHDLNKHVEFVLDLSPSVGIDVPAIAVNAYGADPAAVAAAIDAARA